MLLRRDENSGSSPTLILKLVCSKGGSTVVQDGDNIGAIMFFGGDGTRADARQYISCHQLMELLAIMISCVFDVPHKALRSNRWSGCVLTKRRMGIGQASPQGDYTLEIFLVVKILLCIVRINGNARLRFREGGSNTSGFNEYSFDI